MSSGIKKDVDFFSSVRAESAFQGRKFGTLPLILPCAAVLAVILALWGAFSLLGGNAGRKLESLGTSIGGTAVSLEASGEKTMTAVTDIIAVRQAYAADSALTAKALEAVFAAQPTDLIMTEATYSSQKLTFACKSKRELCGADFAQLLREAPEFSAVDYAGVTAVGGEYSFTVTATIAKEEASKDAN